MIREALTLERLRAMEPGEAAACFVARRAEGLTPSEEELLAAWLGEDEEHCRELRRAERAWDLFSDAGDHEILAAMRAHAVAPRPRRWASWQPAAAAAAILLLVGASLMFFLPRTRDRLIPATARPSRMVSPPARVRGVQASRRQPNDPRLPAARGRRRRATRSPGRACSRSQPIPTGP